MDAYKVKVKNWWHQLKYHKFPPHFFNLYPFKLINQHYLLNKTTWSTIVHEIKIWLLTVHFLWIEVGLKMMLCRCIDCRLVIFSNWVLVPHCLKAVTYNTFALNDRHICVNVPRKAPLMVNTNHISIHIMIWSVTLLIPNYSTRIWLTIYKFGDH